MKRPAVFLDRDGVLVAEKGYVCSKTELEIFSYAKDCIAKIHEKGYYAIVITNQSGVARGLFTEFALLEMNQYLCNILQLDDVFYCPHLETGSVKRYAKKCTCRKPLHGLIKQACEKYEIDIEDSFMVGDRKGDILCGRNAGIKTVLVESGYDIKAFEDDIEADYIYTDLRDFVKALK